MKRLGIIEGGIYRLSRFLVDAEQRAEYPHFENITVTVTQIDGDGNIELEILENKEFTRHGMRIKKDLMKSFEMRFNKKNIRRLP